MKSAEKSARAIKRVLVIFPGALGDLMCLRPALAAISRRHPGASVELMARFELARLVAGRSVVARAHSLDAREVGELFAESSGGARRFFGAVRSDLFVLRFGRCAVSGADWRRRPMRRSRFIRSVPSGDGHVSEGYLRSIGEDASPMEARLEPTSDDLAAAARVLAESKCDGSNLVVIFPGSGSPAKNWPAA